jgi:hypothetical protein
LESGAPEQRTSSGQSTFSARQISRNRAAVELVSSGLNRNFEHLDVIGSMILF